MKPSDLIETARDLTRAKSGKPRQANFRRATSTIYYALFHCLARTCADMVVGGRGAARSKAAWRQAYRALQHRTARSRCEHQQMIKSFPNDIQDFAGMFVEMQYKRHRADYDPAPAMVLKMPYFRGVNAPASLKSPFETRRLPIYLTARITRRGKSRRA